MADNCGDLFRQNFIDLESPMISYCFPEAYKLDEAEVKLWVLNFRI